MNIKQPTIEAFLRFISDQKEKFRKKHSKHSQKKPRGYQSYLELQRIKRKKFLHECSIEAIQEKARLIRSEKGKNGNSMSDSLLRTHLEA